MLEKPSNWLFVRCAERTSPPHEEGDHAFIGAATNHSVAKG